MKGITPKIRIGNIMLGMMGIFPHPRRKRHTHKWKTEFIYNGPTVGARIDSCECGEVEKRLTPAGEQQVIWWRNMGLGYGDAMARVWAGDYPALLAQALYMKEKAEVGYTQAYLDFALMDDQAFSEYAAKFGLTPNPGERTGHVKAETMSEFRARVINTMYHRKDGPWGV